jgi:hypothetical protein
VCPGSLVFVVGPRRCGTTLVNNILCADPAANRHIAEAQLLQRLLNSFAWGAENFERMTRHYARSREGLEELAAVTCNRLVRSCWETQGRPRHLILKNPELSLHVGQLRRYFPDARFVVCVRDPRDQVASERDVARRRNPGAGLEARFSPAKQALVYARYLRSILLEQERSPDAFCFVRYEDLARSPKQESNRLGAFCGLDLSDYDPGIGWQRMEVTRDALAQRPTFSALYGHPVSDARIGRFRERLTPKDIAAVETETGDLMLRFRYGQAPASAVGDAQPTGAGSSAAVEFVMIAEAGRLERQALLLAESIRLLPDATSRAAISVVSPRADRRPSTATVRRLARLDAEYLPLTIDSPCPIYGPSYKLGAMGAVERRPGAAVLVMIDSDTVFLAPPSFDVFPGRVALRPVEGKGISTSGEGDPFDAYWRKLCAICEVDYDALPWIETSVRGRRIRANHNGGLVAANRRDGLFETTHDFFFRSVTAGVVPSPDLPPSATSFRIGSGPAPREMHKYWGSDQAVLSLALVARKLDARLLPPTYNVPCQFFKLVAARHPEVADATVHAHYHSLCDADQMKSNPLLHGKMFVPEAVKDLLDRYLPIDRPPSLGRRIKGLVTDRLMRTARRSRA